MSLLASFARFLRFMLAERLHGAWLTLRVRFGPRDVAAARRLLAYARSMKDATAARLAGTRLLDAEAPSPVLLEELGRSYLIVEDAQSAATAYRLQARLVNDPIEPKLYRNAYMEPERAAKGERYVHVLRDVVLETEYCAIFGADKVYVAETWGGNLAKHRYVRQRHTPDLEAFVVSLPAAERNIGEPFVLLGTDGAANYSHWLMRDVLKLALLEEAGVSARLPLLVNEDLGRHQRESLELLKIGPERLLKVPRGISLGCREVIVPVHLRNHPQMRFGIDWLRARLAHLIGPSGGGERIYVSRRDTANRALLNEAEVEAALEKKGFRTIFPAQMSFAEQVRTFSAAQAVVGPHGAALTNLLFCPAGAKMVEITNTRVYLMNDFRFMAAQMGIAYREVISDRYAQTQGARYARNYDYYVDPALVLQAVEEMGL